MFISPALIHIFKSMILFILLFPRTYQLLVCAYTLDTTGETWQKVVK